jgi:hypothetical protein
VTASRSRDLEQQQLTLIALGFDPGLFFRSDADKSFAAAAAKAAQPGGRSDADESFAAAAAKAAQAGGRSDTDSSRGLRRRLRLLGPRPSLAPL